jgi:membrane protease YdiL (CAAX protease family)
LSPSDPPAGAARPPGGDASAAPRDEADFPTGEPGGAVDRPDADQPDGATPGRPGAGTFTIEGRRAPALFVVGWLATLVGIGTIAVALLSGGSAAAPFLLIGGLVVLSFGLTAGAGSQAIERRAIGARAYHGPSPLLVFAASIPISLVAVILIGLPMTLLGIAVDGPAGRLASVVAQACVYIGLIRLLVVDTGALTWGAMGVRRPDLSVLGDLAGGALWAAPAILLTIPIAAILSALLPVTPVSPLPPAGETAGFVVNLLAGAVVAPFGEEILFRAFATTAWAADLGPRRGLIRGALFFALAHVLTISGGTAGEALALAVIGFASRIPVAILLGWLFLKRRSIWAPIGLHAAFNALLLVLGEATVRSGV